MVSISLISLFQDPFNFLGRLMPLVKFGKFSAVIFLNLFFLPVLSCLLGDSAQQYYSSLASVQFFFSVYFSDFVQTE